MPRLPPGTAHGSAALRRKQALGSRAPSALPSAANERWSLDFVHDQWSTASVSASSAATANR